MCEDLRAVHAEETRRASFFELLPSALSYPVKGTGIVFLILGVFFFGFIKNAFNEQGTTAEFKDGYFVTRPEDNYYGQGQKTFIARPRTIGVSATYWF